MWSFKFKEIIIDLTFIYLFFLLINSINFRTNSLCLSPWSICLCLYKEKEPTKDALISNCQINIATKPENSIFLTYFNYMLFLLYYKNML